MKEKFSKYNKILKSLNFISILVFNQATLHPMVEAARTRVDFNLRGEGCFQSQIFGLAVKDDFGVLGKSGQTSLGLSCSVFSLDNQFKGSF